MSPAAGVARTVVMEIQDEPMHPEFYEVEADDSEVLRDPVEAAVDTTPGPGPSSFRQEFGAPRKVGRKVVPVPSQWKVNTAKTALNTGKLHVSARTGKERSARVMRPGCGEKCNRCQKRLTVEERQGLKDSFWELGNHQRQLDYIASRVKCVTPKKKYAAPGNNGIGLVRLYHFQVGGKDIKVCKKTFLDTLVICDSWIQTATNNSRGEPGFAPPDMRGKHDNRPLRTSESVKNSVRTHINMVPRVESHYTRSRSKREYIELGLTVEELYRRYILWAEKENVPKTASLNIYRKIFNEEFNIGCFKPKKDQCLTCSKWKHATTPEKAKIAREYALHTENRNIGHALKKKDREEAQKEGNVELCVASFDLQKILPCPRSEVSTFYYVNKVSLYNFTVFDMGPRLGVCYMWNETQAKKSSTEVASNVYHFIDSRQRLGVKEFRFYSDNPTSQNKNRFVFAMYLSAAVKFNVKITHRFLEVGHTHMEVDSMHATIERAVDKREIFDEEEWYSHILNAKKNGRNKNDPVQQYVIEKAGVTSPIYDFKELVKAQNWKHNTQKEEMKWTKVKEMSVDPLQPNIVSVKYNYNAEPLILNVNERKGRPVNLKTYVLQKAYEAPFPLPEVKIRDLRVLMQNGSIPPKYHTYYLNLIAIGSRSTNHCEEGCEDCDNCMEEDCQTVSN